jgi:hypothetical protein
MAEAQMTQGQMAQALLKMHAPTPDDSQSLK